MKTLTDLERLEELKMTRKAPIVKILLELYPKYFGFKDTSVERYELSLQELKDRVYSLMGRIERVA